MNAPGAFPLYVTGKLIAGSMLRLLDAKRAVATCVSEPIALPSAAYRFVQPSAAAIWYVNHGLGFQPNVRAYSDGGREMLGEIIHVSLTQTNIYFDQPVSGFAVCS